MIKRLSYQIKVPLNISLVIIITVVVITLTLLGYNYRQMDREMLQNAQSLGRVVAKGVSGAMLREDIWSVWDTVRMPADSPIAGALQPEAVTVTDAGGRVVASSEPRLFRVRSDPVRVDPAYGQLDADSPTVGLREIRHLWAEDDRLLVGVPVIVDGSVIGSVVLEYRRPPFFQRFGGAVGQVALMTTLILLLVLPFGWWTGRRVARPLQQLAGLMDRMGTESPRQLQASLEHPQREGDSADEIDRLRSDFCQMLNQLAEKEALERQMIRADRLAAVGRLTAGIAHEINNPLGGMLNVLSNHRRRGGADGATAHAMDLLERGLKQIRDIVAALLVEARLESHDLTPSDLSDIETLVRSDSRSNDVRLEWSVDVPLVLPLPSTPVRQVLMNLALNAVQAAGPEGRVEVHCNVEAGEALVLYVCNDGRHLSPEQMEHLFEPFSPAQHASEGTGLGLWVSYQVVEQMRGHIDVSSRPGETRFAVRLPLRAGEGKGEA